MIKTNKVMCIGSTCVDIILELDFIPKASEDQNLKSQTMRVGGCAYNVASILQQAGAEPLLVTPVGLDGVYGPFALKAIEEMGFRGPVKLKGKENGCCYCLVDNSGERTFLALHGVEYSFNPNNVEEDISDIEYIYFCGLEVEEKDGDTLIDYLSSQDANLFYAPGSRGPYIINDKHERIYALNPILHLNEDEAFALSGLHKEINTVEEATLKLQEKTHNIIFVTLGPKGALALDKNGEFHYQKGIKTIVKDTIGAGDSHAGAVLTALSNDFSLDDTLMFANEISSHVVAIEGSHLEKEEVLNIFNKYQK